MRRTGARGVPAARQRSVRSSRSSRVRAVPMMASAGAVMARRYPPLYFVHEHRRRAWVQAPGTAPRSCGDGGGSNSPSKALDVNASTSVVGVFLSREAQRAPTRSWLPQAGNLDSAYQPISGPHLRLSRPSRPAKGRPGGRSLTRQRVRRNLCQLSGCRLDLRGRTTYLGSRRSRRLPCRNHASPWPFQAPSILTLIRAYLFLVLVLASACSGPASRATTAAPPASSSSTVVRVTPTAAPPGTVRYVAIGASDAVG